MFLSSKIWNISDLALCINEVQIKFHGTIQSSKTSATCWHKHVTCEVPWVSCIFLCCCKVAVVQSISLLTVLTSSVSCRRRLRRSSSTALFSLRMQLILLPWFSLKSSNTSALDGGGLETDGKLLIGNSIKTTLYKLKLWDYQWHPSWTFNRYNYIQIIH